MANGIAHNLVEQLTVPQFETPAAMVGSVAIAGALVLSQLGIHKHSKEAFAVKNPNPALLKEAVVNPETHRSVKASTLRRLGSSMLLTLGLGLGAGSLLSHPSYESTSPNDSANTAVVMDSSWSMLKTHDMGNQNTSRFSLARKSLSQADYPGSLAVVQFGQGEHISIPLSKDWKPRTGRINNRQVDPNGGDLSHALDTAASLLPDRRRPKKTNGADIQNTILVVSDGTIENTADEISAEVHKLKAQGTNVEVIVPGTNSAKYQVGNGVPLASGIRPDIFKGFNRDQVTVAGNEVALNQAIRDSLNQAGTSKERHDWQLGLGLGVLIGSVGLIKDIWQRARRIV